MLQELDDAIAALRDEQMQRDGLEKLMTLLRAVRADVADHWPLTPQEQQLIFVGRIGVRVFDSPDDAHMARRLAHLEEHLTPDRFQEL